MFGSARGNNPEAGDHAVSLDPVERTAAEAAVRASWREFPYYAKRYGERGWRFSLSDTGWIETLTHLRFGEASAQVRWLSGLLAARGMPTYMMERHLQLLHHELLGVARDRAGRYEVLEHCANHLRELRLALLPEEPFNSLSMEFEARVRGRMAHVANMGVLVVAAAIDEKAGVAGGIASLESWVCDPARFDAEWIGAVRQTMQATRQALNSKPPQ